MPRWCCSRGIAAEDIHGDKEQGERERSLMAFKRGRVQVLSFYSFSALILPESRHGMFFGGPHRLPGRRRSVCRP